MGVETALNGLDFLEEWIKSVITVPDGVMFRGDEKFPAMVEEGDGLGPPIFVEIVRGGWIFPAVLVGVRIHEAHVPNLVVRGTPIVFPRVAVPRLDIDGGYLVPGVLENGHALKKRPIRSIAAIEVKKDSTGRGGKWKDEKKGGNENKAFRFCHELSAERPSLTTDS